MQITEIKMHQSYHGRIPARRNPCFAGRQVGAGGGKGWWQGRFRGCGYRFTVPRQVILDVLDRTSKHLSAEDIYLAVHRAYPNVGLTTVYRTLELLVQMGLVFKFDFGDGRARYELSRGVHPQQHYHLICISCRRIINADELGEKETKKIKQMEETIAKRYNFKIKNQITQFYGLCERCKGGD